MSDPSEQHLQGYNGGQVARVQADCFADSWGVARDMAREVRGAVATPATQGGTRFGRTAAEGPTDAGEDVPGEGFIHRARLDLLVNYSIV